MSDEDDRAATITQIVEDVVGFLWGVAKKVKLEGLRKANRVVSLSAELKQPVAREKALRLLMVLMRSSSAGP